MVLQGSEDEKEEVDLQPLIHINKVVEKFPSKEFIQEGAQLLVSAVKLEKTAEVTLELTAEI